jgi:hypothetical protein
MLALFKFLSINEETDGLIFQKTLYDFLYEPTIAEKKCKNPSCDNESNFDRFKHNGELIGYKPYCSKHCSSVTQPRGCYSQAHKAKQVATTTALKTQRDQETTDALTSGNAVCYYCGAPAVARGGRWDRYRCKLRAQDCPDVKGRIGPKISNALTGVSRIETAELLVTELEVPCNYGCGGIALYRLNGQEGERFSCSAAYQACQGARDHRSDFMTTKYQDPKVKKLFLERMCATNLERHNCDYMFRQEGYTNVIANVLQEKHGKGVTCSALIPGNREKNEQMLLNTNTYSRKDYAWPSGKISSIQGYENIALDQLLNIYKEEQIVTGSKNIPVIDYFYENAVHHYYPDIYISHENKILEVKSPRTYKKDLEKNKAKAQAVTEAGYEFIWLIYTGYRNPRLLNLYALTDEELENEILIEELELEDLLNNPLKLAA